MKRLLPGAAACIAFAAPVFAADLPAPTYPKAPAYKAAAQETVYNWTGFYVGGYAGGGIVGPEGLERHVGQFSGGIQSGFDRQIAPNWVVGSEFKFGGLVGNSGHSVLFPGGTQVTGKFNELGSFTGRVGYAWGPALFYVKGGAAFHDKSNVSASAGGVPVTVTTTGRDQLGITAGGGFEYMFAPHWSARLEYQYYNFGDVTFTGGPAALVGSKFRDDEHTVTLGVNYRFGLGG